MEIYEQHDSHPPPQHLFCPQPQQLGPHYGGPASGIWYERCRRAGHEAKMSAARIPRSPPPYSGSHSYRAKPFVRHYCGGESTALWQQRQQSRPFCSFGWDQRGACRTRLFVRYHSGGDGTAPWPQHQPDPRPFSGFGREQNYNGGHSTALWPQQ